MCLCQCTETKEGFGRHRSRQDFSLTIYKLTILVRLVGQEALRTARLFPSVLGLQAHAALLGVLNGKGGFKPRSSHHQTRALTHGAISPTPILSL